jgi:NADH dehydrogenase
MAASDLPSHAGDGAPADASAAAAATDRRPRIVIVGAGFAGLEAAKRLKGCHADVVLIDRNNYHKFQPLLYEVAMAGLEPDDIAHNVRNIFRGQTNVRFRMGTVTAIDTDTQRVELLKGDPEPYDALILAAGAVTAYYGVEGAREHGFPLKNVPDAVHLRNHVLAQFERYDRDGHEAGPGALTFVLVGGGATGVEMAGAFVELFRTLDDDFPHVATQDEARCLLVERGPHLLPSYDEDLSAYTRRTLEKRGVEVMTNATVERVTAEAVHLADGTTIPTQTLVWAAGVKAAPIADFLGARGATQMRDGRVVVRPDLSVPTLPNVFVTGDMAAIARDPDARPQGEATAPADDDVAMLPGLAQVAMQSGRHAANQVLARFDGRPTEAFAYTDLGQMATIGRNAAVAEVAGGLKFKGFIAWSMWVFIHIAKLVGFRNRASAFVNWAYNYFTYRRSARLLLDVVPISDELPMEVDEAQRLTHERLQEALLHRTEEV